MRTWALPKQFHARRAELMAYRVMAASTADLWVPPGCYVVVRMRAGSLHMRILVGPFEPEEAEHLLETAGPNDLVELLRRSNETPNPHDTLH